MTTEIIVALITLVGTLIGTFSGIVVGTKLINYRIEQLEKKVDKHNQVTVFINWKNRMQSTTKKSKWQITALKIWKDCKKNQHLKNKRTVFRNEKN